MNKGLLLGMGLLAGLGAFGADPRNQAAFKLILRNASDERPPMQGVAFKVPFLKDPPPAAKPQTLYPEHFTWATDAVLKYYSLGPGYWQTNGINLNDGQEIKTDEDEWKAHLRFKSNPGSDPLHPGHEILGMDSPQHHVTFAPLGAVDFDSVRRIPDAAWLKTSPSEQAAVWNLKPGDVVGVRVDAVSLEDSSATGSMPPRRHHLFVAKILLHKLSHDSVRFDFVYRNDGKQDFPPPNPSAS